MRWPEHDGLPGRLLLAQDAFAAAMPDAAAALHPAVGRVTARFGRAEPVTVSREGLPVWFDAFRTLQHGDIREAHGEWVSRTNPRFGPQIAPRFIAVANVDPAHVAAMRELRADISARLDALLADNAVLLLPTVPDVAPLLGAAPEDTVNFRERALSMLCIAGLGGLPQVNLPCATLHGAPLGLSMIAARGNDEMLLMIARELERAAHA